MQICLSLHPPLPYTTGLKINYQTKLNIIIYLNGVEITTITLNAVTYLNNRFRIDSQYSLSLNYTTKITFLLSLAFTFASAHKLTRARVHDMSNINSCSGSLMYAKFKSELWRKAKNRIRKKNTILNGAAWIHVVISQKHTHTHTSNINEY